MKKIIVLYIVNLVVFILLRYASVLFAALIFNYGASAENKYDDILLLPGFLLQILILIYLRFINKYPEFKLHMLIILVLLTLLYVFKQLGYLTFFPF